MFTINGSTWLPVVQGTARRVNGRSRPCAWQLRDARTGAHVGELWRGSDRRYTARREGAGVRIKAYATPHAALTAAGLLPTVHAEHAGARGPIRVIMPGGFTATVHASEPSVDGPRSTDLTITVGGYAYAYTVTLPNTRGLPLAPPCACGAGAGEVCGEGCPERR